MAAPTVKGDPRGPTGLGAANLNPGSVKTGDPDKGVRSQLDEGHVVINLTAAGDINAAHGLNRVPSYARVLEVVAGPSGVCHLSVCSVKSGWSTSAIRVNVSLLSGSLAGAQLRLAVG